MEKEKMQKLIDSGNTPEAMIAVAQAYLDGGVLRDPVAAEGWLMKAIEAGDPVQSPKAMGILAVRVLGKDRVLSDADYRDIQRCVQSAEGAERQELLALLTLASEEQKVFEETDFRCK
ncbi:MAG: hypothetical protein Q4D50_08620 [Eubacteriales bacterium]|nr:hypothetical protein [Eubacteriales bacterium]